jgi:hypothetical protein
MGYACHVVLQQSREQRLDVGFHGQGAKHAVFALPNLLALHDMLFVSVLHPTTTL